jgi:hypothetical protein
MGAVVVGTAALRNRVIQVYLARRLLGAEADRMLTEGAPDRTESLPNTFPQNLYLPMGNSRPARMRSIQTPSLTLLAVPVVPQGWWFDEED